MHKHENQIGVSHDSLMIIFVDESTEDVFSGRKDCENRKSKNRGTFDLSLIN